MPRRKGHGIPPTKRLKQNTDKSSPVKTKPLEISERGANETAKQMAVENFPLRSEPSQENIPVHSKYLHKKFKKMATTALSPEESFNGSRVKGVLFSVPNKVREEEASSPKTLSNSSEFIIPDIVTEDIINNSNDLINNTNNIIINTNIIFPAAGIGRYVCPYCKLACTKPSVLQKHIRAHTNERPYPCEPCGFAFKTKSNLYKHCRSRAHALKMEEVGEDTTNLPLEEGAESSSEDEDIQGKSSELNYNEEVTNDKEDRPAKSIYKPKFHTASIYLQNSSQTIKQEERTDHSSSPPRLQLKMPASTAPQSALSTPSPFTSGSSPSPEFLHRHISKLISENQAIVETMDPFWPKKFLHRTNSKDNNSSSSPLSSSPSPGAESLLPKRYMQRQPSISVDSTSSVQENMNDLDKIGSRQTVHSKLALALLRPQPSTSPRYSNPPSPPSESIDAPLNLTTNSSKIEQQNVNFSNRKRSYSEGIPSPKFPLNKIPNIPLRINNNNQEHCKYLFHSSDTTISLYSNNVDGKKSSLPNNPQNPEGSIIKDLLLKARAASTGGMPIMSSAGGSYGPVMTDLLTSGKTSNVVHDERSFSPSSQFVCHLCKIPFRNAESLDLHQLYYCKGICDESTRSSLNSPSPHYEAVFLSSPDYPSKTISQSRERKDGSRRDPMLIAPSYPSPGPLLGNTPLVESYHNKVIRNHEFDLSSVKKRKFENESLSLAQELRPISTTTLRSLEELSKCPIRSNALQMFGGEVKILDTAGGETKTMRIEPSNRGTPQTSEMSLLISSHPPTNKNFNKDQNETKESSPQIVVTIAKTGLHSGGGTIVQVPQKITGNDSIQQQISKQSSISTMTSSVTTHILSNSNYTDSNKLIIPIIPNIVNSNLSIPGISTPVQLPFIPFTSILSDNNIINPLTSITAYNPLTLPTASLLSAVSKRPPMGIPSPYSGGIVTILHGGKEIPYVPGMPGPHTLLNTNPNLSSFTSKPLEIDFKVSPAAESPQGKSVLTIPHQDPKMQKPEKTPLVSSESSKQSSAMTSVLHMKQTLPIPSIQVNNGPEIPPEQMVNKRKLGDEGSILKLSAPNKRNSSPLKSSEPPVSSEENSVIRSEQNINSEKKFLRPSSLPLKPGTFIPKRHTLSTPTNVLSLVSPETPRPRKSYGQLYLNGHAYTYLGLKCSTRVFFCTLNKPQPIYVPLSPEHNKVSMYSNWKVCSEADPNPFGLDPGKAMAYYDSRHRPLEYSLASSKSSEAVTHSTYWNNRTSNKQDKTRPESTNKYEDNQKSESGGTENLPKRVKIFAGGFESNEEYIYVRGRGRGRYVCEECGIRCKKPSMLKKHIRTHTDVRPFTCIYCKFSFKTKGNLTKHMKSKAHYKKCVELGITPVPTVVDDSNVDEGALARQQTLHREQGIEAEETEEEEDDEDEEDDEEDDDDEDEDMDEWKNCQEREAARSLLSLSETLQSATQRQYVNAGLVAMSARPNTYPYSFSLNPSQVVQPQTPTLTSISAHREREKVSQNTGLAREVHGDVKANNQAGASIDESKGNSSEPGVAARYYFPSTQTMPALQDDSSSSSDNHSRESQEDFMDHDELSNDNQSSPAKNASAVPMDLSNKNSDTEVKPNVRVCEAAMLLASLCSTMERLPVTSTPTCTTVPEDSALLQAYLTERAMRDSRMKQHQYKVIPTNTDTICHINTFQPSATKVTIESVTSKQTEKIQNPSEPVQEVQESSPTKIDHSKVTVSESENISPNPNMSAAKENALGILAQTSSDARKLAITSSTAPGSPTVSGSGSVLKKLKAEFMPPSSGPSPSYVSQLEDGRSMCIICNKVFTKPSQLRLHVNIHYFERPFRCESCAVSFRTKGHLQKHQRSVSHLNKVSMNSTFGAPTTSNPRPFKCDDCKIAFRIHGHLAKHLRSKMHIMKLECLGKLPFGTYAEMERSGINMNDIDTTDCENSLESLQMLAHKLYEKDPSKLSQWDPNEMMPQINQNLSSGDTTSEDEDPGIACPSPPTPISSTSREQFIHKTLIVSPVQRLPAPSVQKASLQRIEPLKYVNLSNTPVESNYKSSKHKSPVSNLVVLTNANDLVGHAQVSKTEMVRSNHDTSKTVAVSESEENRVEDRLSLTVNSELNSDVVIRIGNRNNIIESRTESVDNQNETSDIECYVTRGND